jgi:UbiD family decarboxylase
LTFSASIFSSAKENCPGLVAYTKDPYGTGFFMGIASIRKMYPGHAKHAMHTIWGTQAGKYQKVLIVVDDNIDIHDMREVTWAICTRCRPDRDIHIERDTVASVLDPSMWPKTGIGGRVMMDATEKWAEEGNAPLSQRQKRISHEGSPYWKDLCEKGLSNYLGIDMSPWLKSK